MNNMVDASDKSYGSLSTALKCYSYTLLSRSESLDKCGLFHMFSKDF